MRKSDVPGKCNARLYIGDDYGDNSSTMMCQLEPDHDGPHQETFERSETPVLVIWHVDETPCETCDGCGQTFGGYALKDIHGDLIDFEGESEDCKVCEGTGRKNRKVQE